MTEKEQREKGDFIVFWLNAMRTPWVVDGVIFGTVL
jgi:hypothetical protein